VNVLDYILLAACASFSGCVGWMLRGHWDEYRQTGCEDR
jgi:hypothetical protein